MEILWKMSASAVGELHFTCTCRWAATSLLQVMHGIFAITVVEICCAVPEPGGDAPKWTWTKTGCAVGVGVAVGAVTVVAVPQVLSAYGFTKAGTLEDLVSIQRSYALLRGEN